jgi:hypothetical protein
MMFEKPITPSPVGSRDCFIYLSYASVGQWPRARTKMGNCDVGIVPLSYLSKIEKSY